MQPHGQPHGHPNVQPFDIFSNWQTIMIPCIVLCCKTTKVRLSWGVIVDTTILKMHAIMKKT